MRRLSEMGALRVVSLSALVAASPATAGSPGAAAGTAGGWATPAESSDFEATPSYDETTRFLRRLDEALPELVLSSFGTSAAGRPLPLAVLSREGLFSPEAATASGKPVTLVQAGIHAGEIDGKDAILMLLRDLVLGQRRELLDAGVVLFVPIFNADGHERISPHNRPNQNGPVRGMGFRTTADGHDLNRDFMKLETPEARALVALANAWRPHLHVDLHVTDGVDHDWVVTWLAPRAPQIPEAVDRWVEKMLPPVLTETENAGHRIGPYVELLDDHDPTKGFRTQLAEPRYATAYFALRQRAAFLVETHSHKPYRERVLATRDLLAALLRAVGASGRQLVAAVAGAGLATAAAGQHDAPPSAVTLGWEPAPAERIELPIYAWRLEESVVTGRPELRYRRGEVATLEVPWSHRFVAGRTIGRPRGYLLEPGWPEIERRLADHGLRFERLAREVEAEVESLRIPAAKPSAKSWQGRTRYAAVEVRRLAERRMFAAGSLWIPAAQPEFDLAVQLFEPEAPDSLFAWGFLATVLESKEWINEFVLAPQAEALLADPAVAAEWRRALEDPAFAGDPDARYRWWFERVPSWDTTVGRLPYARALAVPAGAGTR
jgi:hypothetical protein